LLFGEYIVEGDSIVTGKDGELHLDMEDGAIFRYVQIPGCASLMIGKLALGGTLGEKGLGNRAR
jgi:hypothetical protein